VKLVKILESRPVIQSFGLILLLAPLFNVCLTIWSNPAVQDGWTVSFFFKVLRHEALPLQVLNILSFIMGTIMLRGSTQAWKPVLFLLGGHIILQILNLGKNFKAHWFNGVVFLINIAVFLFIFDQLAWKIKRAAKNAAPESAPDAPVPVVPAPAVSVPAPLPTEIAKIDYPEIEFEGIGPWAKLIEITEDHVELELLNQLNFEIADKELDLQIEENLVLKVKFSTASGNRLGFKILNSTPELMERLAQAS
jgi:hypothetical protein